MAPRRRIALPERVTKPVEVPASLQKKKQIKNLDSVIAEAQKMSEKYKDEYICITDKDELIDYIDTIIKNRRAALDTETTGLDIFNDDVVGFSLHTEGKKACYVPIRHLSRLSGRIDTSQLSPEFCAQQLNRLQEVKDIIQLDYFNAQFDMNMLYYNLHVNLWDIKTNDAMLMMRMLDTERSKDNNLKALHADFCAHTTRGPRFNDLFPAGSFNVCPYRYATAYAARDAEMTTELTAYATEQMQLPENESLWHVWETIEQPLIPVLLRMREKGVLIDMGLKAELTEKYRKIMEDAERDFMREYEPYIPLINQWRQKYNKVKGKTLDMPVKIGSDDQIQILFWDIMKLPHAEGAKCDKEAIKATNSKIGEILLKYREAKKLLSTYLEGLDKFIQKDGCVHGGIKQLGAATSRTSACIAEGMLVECPGERKPIEQIKPGDLVYSYEVDGTLCLRKVLAVYDNGIRPCIELKWQSSGNNKCGTLVCTPDHWIRTKYNGWKMADHLLPREKVYHLHSNVDTQERFLSGTNEFFMPEHHWLKYNYFNCTDSSLHIHHKNGNHFDNRIENLEILTQHNHLSLHAIQMNAERKRVGIGKYLGKMTEAQRKKYAESRKKHDKQYFVEHGYAYQGLPYTKEQWIQLLDAVDWRPNQIKHDFTCVVKSIQLHGINYIDEYRKRSIEINRKPIYMRLQPIHMMYALKLADGDENIAASYFGVPVEKFVAACAKYGVAYNHIILSIADAGERHVYDLMVEATHCFIANELCVHNCDPNLQNIPSHNREIRQMYIARPGCYLISCDYSAQEPRITACVSQDPGMIQAYKEGKDLYRMIAAAAYNTTYEECREHNEDGSLYLPGKERRTAAKSIVLGICYGRQIKSIAEQLKCSEEEAQEIYNKVTKNFPGLIRAQEAAIAYAHEHGYVSTLYGSRRHLKVMMHDDYEFKYRDGTNPEFDPYEPELTAEITTVSPKKAAEFTERLKKAKWRKYKEAIIAELSAEGIEVVDYSYKKSDMSRKCLNSQIQGTAANISKIAMRLIDSDDRLKKINTYLLLMVHDEVICECPREHLKEACTYISEDMVKATEGLEVPFLCDCENFAAWYGPEVVMDEDGEIIND